MKVTLRLPWPPSVNHYWMRTKHGGMMVSGEGRQYKEEVALCVLQQCGVRFTEEERIREDIVLYPPDRRKRDIENILKALNDALEGARVFPDDSQIDKIDIERCQVVVKGGEVIVQLGVIE